MPTPKILARTVEERLTAIGAILVQTIQNGLEPDAPEMEMIGVREGIWHIEMMESPGLADCFGCGNKPASQYPIECIHMADDVAAYLNQTVYRASAVALGSREAEETNG